MTSAIFPWRFGQFRRGSAAGAILVAMRIATWNVDGLRARMDFITHWLKSRAPDVVGLQEVKVSDEDFPHDNFRALGYHAVVHGAVSWRQDQSDENAPRTGLIETAGSPTMGL